MQPLAEKFEQAVQRVFERFYAMEENEFRAGLKLHKDGDLSRILLETGALEIFELEGWDEREDEQAGKPDPSGQVWFPASLSQAETWISSETWIHLSTLNSHLDFDGNAVVCESPAIWSDRGTLKRVKEADDYLYNLAA